MQLVLTARVVPVTLSFNLKFLVPLALKVPYVTQQLLRPTYYFIYSFVKEYGGRYVLISPYDRGSELSQLFYTRQSALCRVAFEETTSFQVFITVSELELIRRWVI
jgi:hypothetical protein